MKRSSTAKVWIVFLVACWLAASCAGGKQQETRKPPELSMSDKVRLAEAYVKGGRIADALPMLEQAIEQEPGNAVLHNFYGQVCFLAGRYPQAEESFRKALELDPYLTDAHNNLGALYDKTGRKDEAEQEFLTALRDPAYATPQKVHLNLGLLYSSQGRTEHAIERYRQAVEIDPRYYDAHYELASILDRTGKLEEAAREYEVAAPAYRKNGEYHLRLGFTYFRLGDKPKAKEHLTRVVEISPGSNSAVRADELLKRLE